MNFRLCVFIHMVLDAVNKEGVYLYSCFDGLRIIVCRYDYRLLRALIVFIGSSDLKT